MKKYHAVSFFNKNNVMIQDLSEEQLKTSNLIVCLDPNEIENNAEMLDYFFKKVKDYLLLDMVDLTLTEDEFKELYHKKTTVEVNLAMGFENIHTILPSKKHIDNVINFIEKHKNEDFIVACSAGLSRSGALAYYLNYLGYSLKEPSNTEFFPNFLVLNELIIRSKHSFENTFDVKLLEEKEDELIFKINNATYSYSKEVEDDYTYFISNQSRLLGSFFFQDIFILNGFGMRINKESKLNKKTEG